MIPNEQEIVEAIDVAYLKCLRELYAQASDRLTDVQEQFFCNAFKLGFKEGCIWFGKIAQDLGRKP